MESLLQAFREHPALIGIGLFVLVSGLLAVVLGRAMLAAGGSLKPLVFFFGFLAIVGGPQAVVHGLDALAHHREAVANGKEGNKGSHGNNAAGGTALLKGTLAPVGWDVVFGPKADPSLITSAKAGLDAVFSTASEANLSFSSTGESALAARFGSAAEAAAAVERYGTFFQFAQVSGSDAGGWTAKRFGGQGEWNHVVAAGNELYAWTGPTRESVQANRVRALGPLPEGGASSAPAAGGAEPSKRQVSNRLSENTPVMVAFLAINLVLAVGWFFKASAWAARVVPEPGAQPTDGGALRGRILALNEGSSPVEIKPGADGQTLEVTWRYADAQWFDLMRVHKIRRTHKLVLTLEEASRKVRVREFWSAFDASAGPDGLRLEWQQASGIQFFQVEHQKVFGAQLGPDGKPTGEMSATISFNLQDMKRPVIEAVSGAGWTWQPVVWNAPAPLRWLTE